MSKPMFYMMKESPPCRAVIAVARIIGLEMDMKIVNLREGEHLKPDYLKINPFHQVPTFVDVDGFVIPESRAIIKYLIESKKPDSSLFPKDDVKKRATIDRWLNYDYGMSAVIREPFYERFKMGLAQPTEYRLNKAKECLKTLDSVLESMHGKFLVDDQLSLADISMYFTVNMVEFIPDYNLEEYPHIKAWYMKVAESLKPYDQDGMFANAVEEMKKKFQMK